MLLYEYDERKHLKNTYKEGQYKGRQQKAYQTARNLYRRGFSIKDTAGSPASSMAFPISCRIY